MNLIGNLLDHDTDKSFSPKEVLKNLWVLRHLSEGIKLKN